MSNRSTARRRIAPWLLILLLAPAVVVWRGVVASDDSTVPPPGSENETVPAIPSPAVETSLSSTDDDESSAPPVPLSSKKPAPPEQVAPDPALLARFKSFREALAAGMPRDEVLATLADLKKQVHDLPPEVAAATLIALLKLGDDAATGLHFVVGNEGVLDEAPTYRVALLDLLGQTEPEAIVDYSRVIITESARPDEVAIGLRNLAWLNYENQLDRELVTAFGSLLDRTDWRTAPSDGYLEAFDIAVAIGGTEMLTNLVSVLRLTTPDGKVGEPAVNRAAFIALDRLVLRQPDLLAGVYVADPTFMDFAPNHRASLLARLDPASPAQAQALRTFLLSAPPDTPALAYFGTIFPNASYFDGNRLVTSWENPGADRVAERDARVLAFVNSLLVDPAYKQAAPVLQKIRERLQSFID